MAAWSADLNETTGFNAMNKSQLNREISANWQPDYTRLVQLAAAPHSSSAV